MQKFFQLLLTVCFALTLTSCAEDISSNTYSAGEMSGASSVVKGVIITKRDVKVKTESSGGGYTGASAGSILGSLGGRSYGGVLVGAMGGALVGGIVGNSIDKSVSTQKGFEYVVRLHNGNIISLVQAADANFAINQHIMILYGARTRVIADPAFPALQV